MSGIVFDLWVEDWNNEFFKIGSFSDYEEAQYEGLTVINSNREVTHWHITVMGQKPQLTEGKKLPQSSLHDYYEHNEVIPA